MGQCFVGIGLIWAQTLEDNGIRALAVKLDLPIRAANDSRHALPGRIELANIQYLVLLSDAENIDKDRFWLPSLYRHQVNIA